MSRVFDHTPDTPPNARTEWRGNSKISARIAAVRKYIESETSLSTTKIRPCTN
jgi:hypothetical protein